MSSRYVLALHVAPDLAAGHGRDVCKAFECPRPAEVSMRENPTPALYNDPALTSAAVAVFRSALGQDAVERGTATMGGEDFARCARELEIPGLMFRLGAVEPAALKRSRRRGAAPLPGLHSPGFAPDAQRALPTGVRAMASLSLAILHK